MDKYEEMLSCLPPERMTTNAFLVGEPVDHNENGQPRFDMYFEEGNKFYCAGLATISDFETWLLPDNFQEVSLLEALQNGDTARAESIKAAADRGEVVRIL